MSNLINFFISRSFMVNLISAFIILAGFLFGSMIQRDLIPPWEYKMVIVEAHLPGASATEVEKYLTYPFENVLLGLPHAKELTSKAEEGKLKIKIYYDAGYKDIDDSVERIHNFANTIRWQLPEQARDIIVKQAKVESVFHLGVAMENFVQTNPEHRQIIRRLGESIETVPGIVQVYRDMPGQNVYVYLDPDKIAFHEISIAEVRQKIREALDFSPIGKVDFDDKSFAIEVQRPAEAIDALNKLAVRGNRTGDMLLLSELGSVSLQVDELKELDRFNGHPSVNLWIRKDTVTDSIDLKTKVIGVIDQFNETLPDGLKAVPFIDGPRLIQKQLSTLSGNGLFGFALVILILTLFFNFRVSIVTSFGIPIAYCGTLIVLYALGISIDLISVVGMILVLGILVDDAIIIAERYMENLEKGLRPKQAAFEASRDLMIPVTGTVLTTIFAFSPMILIASEIAIVFYAIPVVIITSLIMSWLESFFILPNHLYHFIKKAPQSDKKDSLFASVKGQYVKVLNQILRFRYIVVVALVAFMGVSIWVAMTKVQQDFNFQVDIERVSVNVVLKESPSLHHTADKVNPIEKYMMTLPKDIFGNVSTSIGEVWTDGHVFRGYKYAKVSVFIREDITNPNEIKKKYKSIVEEEVKKVINMDEFQEVGVNTEMHGKEETKKDMVTVQVIGHEDVDFLTLKNSIAKVVKDQKLNLELVKDMNEFDEKWVFVPNNTKMAQHQMGQSDLTRQLRSFFVPHELTQIRMDGETKWVYTQIKRDKVFNNEELSKISILNRRGLEVPLAHLGKWTKKKQLASISHRDGKRIFGFDLSFDPEKDMNVVKAKEQAAVVADIVGKQYPTYTVKVEDADKVEAESRAWAAKVALLCVILVLFTLALVLNSLTLPLIVGMPIPFGLMGIIWALFLHDMKMGMMSLVGLIGTVGVSVNDSLIMVDQINKRSRRRGFMKRDDIIDGASSRLRAIILTTVTTLGGVFPMAYGIGGESGFTQPLAFSIGWGLFFSTFLTLFALPAFIDIRRDFGNLFRKVYTKYKLKKHGRYKTAEKDKEAFYPPFEEKEEQPLPELETTPP